MERVQPHLEVVFGPVRVLLMDEINRVVPPAVVVDELLQGDAGQVEPAVQALTFLGLGGGEHVDLFHLFRVLEQQDRSAVDDGQPGEEQEEAKLEGHAEDGHDRGLFTLDSPVTV